MSMTSSLKFYSSLPAETRWTHNRWCATQKNLALYAYGKTAQEASSRLMEAMDALVKTLIIAGGEQAVRDYMNRVGLPFEIGNGDDEKRAPISAMLPFVCSLEAD
jgi:hypothetical protein